MKLGIAKIGVLVVILGLLLALSGCGSSSGMGGIGTGDDEAKKIDSITIIAPPSVVGDGVSTSDIQVEVRDQEKLLYQQKTSVSFTTSLGVLSAKSAITVNGIAQVTLTSPSVVGVAYITASAGGIVAEEKISFIEPEKIASVTLMVDPPSVFGDGVSTSVVTAEVRNETGQLYQKETSVSFTTSLGVLSAKSANTVNGVAQVTLTSPSAVGEASISASAGGIFAEEKKILFIPVPKILALSLSQFTVKSDSSDSSTVTATILDTHNAPIEGAIVSFNVDGGQISASTATSNEEGKAEVVFSAGTSDRSNRSVSISASIAGLSKVIPIQIIGSTIEIAPENDLEVISLEIGGKKEKDVLTITLKDAGEKPIYGAVVSFSSDPAGALRWELAPGYENSYIQDESGNQKWITDAKGVLKMSIIGAGVAEKAALTVDAVGLKASQTYAVSSIGEVFRILSPEVDIAGIPTNQDLTVTVNAPAQTMVRFSTTFGSWENGKKIIDVPVTAWRASANLKSSIAGVATVQAIDPNNPKLMDIVTVAIYAPSIEASQVAIQASSGVVGLSTDEVKKTVTITATVKNKADQVVGNAPVAFTIENATGGGETVSPAIVYTNESGIAKTTFSSGSISSDAKGVTIRAFLVGIEPEVSDDISIIIGGTAGSISIGRSNFVESVNNDTAYELPMSIIVADSNGNPVPGAKVSVGVWPINYATGFWPKCHPTSDACCVYRTGIYGNEDANRNLILDPGEDTNDDKQLTPPNSAAGTIVITQPDGTEQTGTTGILTTDEKGIGEFKLLYLKSSAGWIEDEITATTVVQGSETQSVYKMWLLPSAEDATACSLPPSPFNIQTLAARIVLTAAPATLVADDGKSTSTIRATVTDLNTNNIPDGTTVTFTTTAGTLDPTSAVTKDGKAQVTLKSPKFSGLGYATVTASADEIEESIDIVLTPGEPTQIQQRPDEGYKSNLTADGVSTSIVKFRVTDANGNLVQDNIQINFSLPGEGMSGTGNGTLSSSNGFTKDGEVLVTYTAPKRIVADAGTDVSVTASHGNVSSSPVTIKLINAVVGGLTVTPGAQRIVADGSSTVSIRAEVLDKEGQPVNDGTPVTFSTTAGTFSGQQKIEGSTIGGIASVNLTSSTTAGTADITVTAGGISGTASIDMIPGAPTQIKHRPDTGFKSNLTADGVSTSIIKFRVMDANDNLVQDNIQIIFSLPGEGVNGTGTLSSYNALTQGGEVQVTYTAPKRMVTDAGTDVSITASYQKVISSSPVSIKLINTVVGQITVTPGAQRIVANGTSTVSIRAEVFDKAGQPVNDGTPVTFSSSTGTFGGQPTTVGGIASATLTSSETAGTANITVTAGGISGNASVEFIADKPASIEITATPDTLTADGQSTSSIKIIVYDANRNPVNSERVTFSALDKDLKTAGSLDKLFASTSDGVVEVTYTAPLSQPKDGVVTVKATTSNNVTGTIDINVEGPQVSDMTLTASPESIPIKGSTSIIRATVALQGGNVPVIFTVNPKLGVFDPDDDSDPYKITKNTSNGVATVYFKSGDNAGTVTVKAETSGMTAQVQIELTPGSVTVVPEKAPLLGTGKEQTEVLITLKNADGNIPTDDQSGNITLSLNDQSLGSLTPLKPVAGEFDKYTTTFSAFTKGGKAVITAIWTTGNAPYPKGTAEIIIQPPPAFIEMARGEGLVNPNPSQISIKGTGGQSTSQLFFDVKDAQGNPVADGYRIDFRIITGPDGGEEISPAFDYTKTIGTDETAIKGRVGLIVKSGYKSGPVSIRASYITDDGSNVWTSSSHIAIAAGPPVAEAFNPFAQFLNITGLEYANLPDRISISAADMWGNAIPNNTVISFKTYNTGGFFEQGSSTTTDGIATSTLRTGGTDPMCGVISVTAEAVNGGRTTHVTSMSIFPENVDNHIIYVGTNGGGVYKSTDSGTTWRNISASSSLAGQNWIQSYVNSVSVDPDNKNVVYAATGYLGEGNIYRSLDGGNNWNSNRTKEWYGIFPVLRGAALCVLTDDGSDYVWTGTEVGIFYTREGGADDPEVIFHRSKFSDLTDFNLKTTKIVKVPRESSGSSAILYAGTTNGVYKSTNGGQTWSKTSTFVGESIISIALHPSSDGFTDKIYVGTEDSGVFISSDSGSSWTAWNGGLGKGISASVPKANDKNKGNGVMSKVNVLRESLSENWSVRCEEIDANGCKFSLTGTVSGNQTENVNVVNVNPEERKYELPNKMEFTIKDGTVAFEAGDTFTFRTTRDPERTIKYLMVDPTHNKLYAITYFNGPQEPHPVGNVYVHNLDLNGAMIGEWREANKDMPQYDPPDDTTLFAAHVMGREVVNGNTTSLFIGGDGINLMKAKTGLDTGAPSWQESKAGLTNGIFARIPILFSGTVSMNMASGIPGTYNEATNQCDPLDMSACACDPQQPAKCNYNCVINPFYPDKHFVRVIGGNECQEYFFIYVEDICGNPPIVGSKLTVSQVTIFTSLTVIFSVEYPDTLMHSGTWRDHGYAATNLPYVVRANAVPVREKIVFEFEPKCQPESPGCSGSKQTVSY